MRVPCEGGPVGEGTVVTGARWESELDSAVLLVLLVEEDRSTHSGSLGIRRAASERGSHGGLATYPRKGNANA